RARGATAAQALPHRVLTTCFVQGTKSRHAAGLLGLSERQLSRERSRAVSLLTAQLVPPHAGAPPAAPPALPDPLLARPRLVEELTRSLRVHRRVAVAGPAGAGKTVLVASHAAAAAHTFWYRVTPRARRVMPSLLFDLGEHLAPEDTALSEYLRASLPDLDGGLATRIALRALAGTPRLLVLDGFGDGPVDPAVESFLDEVAARLPLATIVTIARQPLSAPVVHVPPFDLDDVRALVTLHGGKADERVTAELHSWTEGHGRAVGAAAAWLARRHDARALRDALRGQPALSTNLRGLAGAARRRYGRSVSSIS
ncbi:MAG TPA: hypothetical protein VHI71_11320, partial [Actinomycetota bacterium]|nr:hypothetical protein [Actinomycetota bacterium]